MRSTVRLDFGYRAYAFVAEVLRHFLVRVRWLGSILQYSIHVICECQPCKVMDTGRKKQKSIESRVITCVARRRVKDAPIQHRQQILVNVNVNHQYHALTSMAKEGKRGVDLADALMTPLCQ